MWAGLGLTPSVELHTGHQSRVYVVEPRSAPLIVKLVRSGPGDAAHRERIGVVRRLAETDAAVVGPVELGSDPITEVDGWLAVCYPHVAGSSPDTNDRNEVEWMAAALAGLHESLASLPETTLPPVAALIDGGGQRFDEDRLIHGDYGAANLIVTPSGLRIIDFDDCGRGSVEFEIGNTLYMVRFDAWLVADLDRYDRFRTWFVDRYRREASIDIDEAMLDGAIGVRTEALARWLREPSRAPTGIRTASTAWRRRLQDFIDDIRPFPADGGPSNYDRAVRPHPRIDAASEEGQ